MRYRRLGKAGIKVSEIAYGSWVTAGGKYQAEDSIACHRKAFELGINCFDTADIYQEGQAEEILGKILQDLSRKDIVLATKCAVATGPGPNDRGTHRKHVRESCEASLRRLKTDYLDLYQAHRYDEETPLEETCRAFEDLVRQGKILYWGISNWTARLTAEAVGLCVTRGFDQPVSSQPPYNAFEREIEKDLMPVCAKAGIGFIVYSPLAQGLLAGRYAGGQPPAGSRASKYEGLRKRLFQHRDQEAVQALNAIAREASLTLSQLSLAWILRREEVSAAIIGASQPAQVEENCKASGVKLDESVLTRIEEVLAQRLATLPEKVV